MGDPVIKKFAHDYCTNGTTSTNADWTDGCEAEVVTILTNSGDRSHVDEEEQKKIDGFSAKFLKGNQASGGRWYAAAQYLSGDLSKKYESYEKAYELHVKRIGHWAVEGLKIGVIRNAPSGNTDLVAANKKKEPKPPVVHGSPESPPTATLNFEVTGADKKKTKVELPAYELPYADRHYQSLSTEEWKQQNAALDQFRKLGYQIIPYWDNNAGKLRFYYVDLSNHPEIKQIVEKN